MNLSSQDLDLLSIQGYSSKLFSDNDKKAEIDSGKTLICWMGILMDRFDCRGHLTNLQEFDSDFCFKGNVIADDSDDLIEAALDETLNEERYFELHRDMAEERILLEEENKRNLQQTRNDFGAVSFNYDKINVDSPIFNKDSDNSPSNNGNCDDVYELSPDLRLPYNMEIPQTDKVGLIIERTAEFVARQGTPMEIYIKTKQANNPQFEFLKCEHPLNPFYRFLVGHIKSGKFQSRNTVLEKNSISLNSKNGEHCDEVDEKNVDEEELNMELHIPKVDISTTPYAALINMFKPQQLSPLSQRVSTPPTENECVDKLVIPESQSKPLPNTETDKYRELYEYYYKHYFSYYYSAYSNCYQQTNQIDNKESEIIALSTQAAQAAAFADVQKYAHSNTPNSTPYINDSTKTKNPSIPSEKEREIIIKLAEYVVRNGDEFEKIVQSKDKVQFAFLEEDHPFNSLYVREKKRMIDMKRARITATEIIQAKLLQNSQSQHSTICFSLKKCSDSVKSKETTDSDSNSNCSTPSSDHRRKQQIELRDKLAAKAELRINDQRKQMDKELRAERKRKAELFIHQKNLGPDEKIKNQSIKDVSHKESHRSSRR